MKQEIPENGPPEGNKRHAVGAMLADPAVDDDSLTVGECFAAESTSADPVETAC